MGDSLSDESNTYLYIYIYIYIYIYMYVYLLYALLYVTLVYHLSYKFIWNNGSLIWYTVFEATHWELWN